LSNVNRVLLCTFPVKPAQTENDGMQIQWMNRAGLHSSNYETRFTSLELQRGLRLTLSRFVILTIAKSCSYWSSLFGVAIPVKMVIEEMSVPRGFVHQGG
jgi:hypothetical protein